MYVHYQKPFYKYTQYVTVDLVQNDTVQADINYGVSNYCELHTKLLKTHNSQSKNLTFEPDRQYNISYACMN